MKQAWAGFRREVRGNGWRVIVASAIGYGLGLNVVPYYTIGNFIAPLGHDFGWSHGQVQGALTFLVLATVLGSSAFGWLSDNFGVRFTAVGSQLGLALGLALLGLTPAHLWYWYGMWFLMALTSLGTTPITWTKAIADVFDKGRGLAMALALCGSAVSIIIAPVAVATVIEASDWRTAYFAMGALILLLALPATLIIMPTDRTARVARGDRPLVLEGLTVREALSTRAFWALFASMSLLGFAISGIIPNLVPMMVGHGVPPTRAASILGVIGAAIVLGRLATGYALDRVWAPLVGLFLLPLPAIACLILTGPVQGLALFTLCAALLGVSTGTEIDIAPYIVTRYFGLRRYSQIYGILWSAFALTAGLAPAFFGFWFDRWGTYDGPLYIGMACFLVAPLLLLAMGRYPVALSNSDLSPTQPT